ncbi:hypothetical protein AAG570_012248 [Ranatra chinensis]|uniref:Uncharacterized protein n=1 Tax=Ranatra chinensis TaxID=642074 RepID=A0ABD0YI89_9HEMI
MSLRSVLAICIALGVAAYAIPADPDSDDPTPVVQDNNKYHMEPECGKVGGMCMLAEDCPPGLLSKSLGLCPQQQSLGVECCHGLSIRERRCSARGGACRPVKGKCPRQLMLDADDCPNGFTCCALV